MLWFEHSLFQSVLFTYKMQSKGVVNSCLIFILFCSPSVRSDSDDWGNFVYEPGEWETMVVDLIKREVPSLPIEDFADDPQLLQRVDRVNKLTVYKELTSKTNQGGGKDEAQTIYSRKSVDSKEPVVVLRTNEDHLPIHERKRTFVVLRQNPETNNTYFLNYAYLRFWTDKTKNCRETYLNEKICIEWDTWDNDRAEIKLGHKFFGWTDCASSFLFSCISAINGSSSPSNSTTTHLVERGYRNQTLTHEQPWDEKLEWKPNPSVPMDDTIDAFFDLEIIPGEGRYIRETIRHSSLFGNGIDGQTGRSMVAGGSEQLTLMKDDVEKASKQKKQEKVQLHKKLKGKMEWYREKGRINNILRTYLHELGSYYAFSTLEEILNDPIKGDRFRRYRDAGVLLETLDELGQSYNVKVANNEATSTSSSTIKLLMDAEIANYSPNDKHLQELPGTVTLGRALLSSNPYGRSLGEGGENHENKVAAVIAKSVLFAASDTFQIPGWKRKTSNQNESLEEEIEATIFYGLGSCPFISDQEKSYTTNLIPNEEESVVRFWLTLFRTQCLPEAKEYLKYLLNEDESYLRINGKGFAIRGNINEKRKLRIDEMRKLSASLELVAFSMNYEEHYLMERNNSNTSNSKEPTGPSRSVKYLVEFGYKYISLARELGDEHFIKLCRNLVITFKGVMTKLIQDQEILLSKSEGCEKSPTMKQCQFNLHINARDLMEIHSFMEFLIHGLAMIEKSQSAGISQLHSQFVKDNEVPLKKSLSYYI